jgi:hypothetical protein
MNRFKYIALAAAIVGVSFAVLGSSAQAQISINIGVGSAPDCPYGYYDVHPYACAPYGYYGSEWFVGGAFVGAGPWFHGPANFRGHVNNHMDLQRGYRGHTPARGERADPARPPGKVANFRGNEMRDGRGHVSGGPKH